ncbi:hypothetical protein FM037_06150 [Shewanella psychropiezotolerans]|uniref:Lipoprotein n=1 Tax=Shewanella psychropiezotolerans TaxID=2593655 RepID=A0ABX5WWU3_9GAMM|nr:MULTISPECIES: hypothetical protein [Shewanella]MPY23273.1 hypothetical protein [Shewanella sp. YLB-07]QDO82892.1 hypothetical protein FM037_06150 [Shewanella psychropiezotolerans]
MKSKLALIGLVSLSVLGCSSTTPEPKPTQGIEAYIGVGNVDYDSQYHFGYDQGCKSAITVKADGGSLTAFKDTTLDGLDSFDEGWNAGTQACQDGMSRSMYTVTKP